MRKHIKQKPNTMLAVFLKNPQKTATGLWWQMFGVFSLIEGFTENKEQNDVISIFPDKIAILVGLCWIYAGLTLIITLYSSYQSLHIQTQFIKSAFTAAIFSGFMYSYETTVLLPDNYMAIYFGLFNFTLALFSLLVIEIEDGIKRRRKKKTKEAAYDVL